VSPEGLCGVIERLLAELDFQVFEHCTLPWRGERWVKDRIAT
jgi:hypothetical protein